MLRSRNTRSSGLDLVFGNISERKVYRNPQFKIPVRKFPALEILEKARRFNGK
jgi:hypothetical protein